MEENIKKESIEEHNKKIGLLWDADENCRHELNPNEFSGVRCIKCEGWFCY